MSCCAVWKKCSPKSTSDPEPRSPSTSTCFSGRCQPRGRVTTVGPAHVGAERRRPCPRATCTRGCRAPHRAGCARCRRRCAQVGLEASSRSASHTRAPEFSALIAIFAGDRRAGDLDPAIGERVGRGRHAPVGGAHRRGLGQEVERFARGDALAAFVPRGEQLATAGSNRWCSCSTKASASSVRISSPPATSLSGRSRCSCGCRSLPGMSAPHALLHLRAEARRVRNRNRRERRGVDSRNEESRNGSHRCDGQRTSAARCTGVARAHDRARLAARARAHGVQGGLRRGRVRRVRGAARHAPTSTAAPQWTAVNACLVPVAALDGQEVVTAEGLGTPRGAAPRAGAASPEAGGSQCGYCTPGFACSMAGEFYRADRSARRGRAQPADADDAATVAPTRTTARTASTCTR